MLNKLGILVMVAGVAGFALTFFQMIHGVSLTIWGGAAVVGMLVTVFTGRPGD
jgi:hypothetical protein